VAQITDADILARLAVVEDATVERKASSDYRDVAKAATAFSNSMPEGEAAIIFVGVRNSGEIEDNLNLERLQKNVSGEIGNVYPPIYPQILVREKDGKKFVAVIVEGSQNRPHFAGKSYLRDGTQTVTASFEMFQELIDRRNAKTNEILKWKAKQVRLNVIANEETVRRGFDRVITSEDKTVLACNPFYVTLQTAEPHKPTKNESITLRRIDLSYDHHRNCLVLEVSQV
jgi:predicted HTH transcriptional regulator